MMGRWVWKSVEDLLLFKNYFSMVGSTERKIERVSYRFEAGQDDKSGKRTERK